MCGFVGVFNKEPEVFATEKLKSMNNSIAHRGPDGEGYFIEPHVALGHQRLAILDISSKANQPMTSKSGRYVIAYNGCIYNFLELKQTLQAKGHEFVTTSDTEVIVEGVDEYGPEYFKQLNGMFSIVVWDRHEQQLHLSRDRFGIKPLYYWFNGSVFVFGSEIKAILKHPAVSTQLNINALNEYFTFQNLFSYRTLFEGVFVVPPANTMTINKATKELTHNSWWDYDFNTPDENMTFSDAVSETKRLFENAVVKQLVSDVPVGAYLSGGMDSGSIAAIASANIDRLSTFTCGFDMSKVSGVESNYDERRDAEIMSSFFGTEQFEQVIQAGDIKWSLPRLVYHLEDLRVGMSYPNYYISRLASKFVKVCLQGTGGDELFGGYPWRYYHVFDSLGQKDFLDQYFGFWQRLVPENQKADLFQDGVFKGVDKSEPREIFERVFRFNSDLRYARPEDHINNSLYFEIKTFLPGLLFVGDKLSMANGLEERYPFLDNDLVDFAQKIPVKYKLGNLSSEIKKIDENEGGNRKKTISYQYFDDGKSVLRKAMIDYIPEQILNRNKQGFSAPDESWYRGANADYVKDLLLGSKTASSEYIRPEYVRKIVDEHIDKRINHRLLIWSLMNFEVWCKTFL